MVGMFDASHCGPCGSCIPPCDIYLPSNLIGQTTDPFITVHGTWVYTYDGENSKWSTTDFIAAIVSSVNTEPGNANRARARFNVLFGSSSSSVQWRFVLNGSDTLNYNYAEVLLAHTAPDTYLLFKVGKVRAGAVTPIAISPFNHPIINIKNLALPDGSYNVSVELGWTKDGHLSGHIFYGNSSISLTARDVDAPGEFAGVFALGVTGTLTFDQFYLTHLADDDTLSCAEYALNCAAGTIRTPIIAEIIAPTPYNSPTNKPQPGGGLGTPACAIKCDELAGTYTLTHGTYNYVCDNFLDPFTGTEVLGDNVCSWWSPVITDPIATPVVCGEQTFSGNTDERHGVQAVINTISEPGLLTGTFNEGGGYGTSPYTSERVITVFVYWYWPFSQFGFFMTCEVIAMFHKIVPPIESWVPDEWIELDVVMPTSGSHKKCNNTPGIRCRVKI